MTLIVAPERTHALVVGIEKYDAGSNWDLDGPAGDARRFVVWLLANNVPEQNIHVFLSPTEANAALNTGPGPAALPATRQNIENVLLETLRPLTDELLFVFWAGHGVVTANGTRRLLYADATQHNKLNLNLNSVLTTLRSTLYRGFARQIFAIDACANYVEQLHLTVALPDFVLPTSAPQPGREQFVLMGAKPGQVAANLAAQKTDLFGDELLKILDTEPKQPWPPDMNRVRDRILSRFTELYADSPTVQTPTFFWYVDWNAGEGWFADQVRATTETTATQAGGQVGLLPASSGKTILPAAAYVISPPGSTGAKPPRQITLSFQQRGELVDRLLNCPCIKDNSQRATVIDNLPREIASAIPNAAAPRGHVINIVTTCLNFPQGLTALLEIVAFFDQGTYAFQALQALLQDLGIT